MGNMGALCCRAIVTAEKALLFEPGSANTRRLLDAIVPRLQAAAGQRMAAKQAAQQQQQQQQQQKGAGDDGSGSSSYLRRDYTAQSQRQQGQAMRHLPFELEVLEGVMTVATGRLDTDVLNVTKRVGTLLTKLPREINPVNLEELRRIKQVGEGGSGGKEKKGESKGRGVDLAEAVERRL